MDATRDEIPEYDYRDALPTWSCSYLWPAIQTILASTPLREKRAFDLGCGNGSTCKLLSDIGFQVVGIDPSESGIAQARAQFPNIAFHKGSAYDDLAALYGRFPLVVGLEVVEHCYDPARFAQTLYDLVEEGGVAMVSTPYHGYLKNLALALAGKWDAHLAPLWDGGHIKFFSSPTLVLLLKRAGFKQVDITRVGRVPPLAKSMVAVARK